MAYSKLSFERKKYSNLRKRAFIKNHKRSLYDAQNGICKLCNKSMIWPSRFNSKGSAQRDFATLDHIKPLVLGGTNNLDNLMLICQECNNKKGVFENKLSQLKAKLITN